MKSTLEHTKENIIYFDGECILCDHSVQFILKRDHQSLFLFASLQSEYASKHLPKKFRDSIDLKTVYLHTGNKLYEKSDVSVQVLKKLNGIYRFLGLALGCLPKMIRDYGYDFIAKQRYRIFGKKEVCGIEVNKRYKSRILS